ncbi:MAG: hypothetical protein J6S62_05795, partial [Bacteroidales bacterium]|nr:hypothetical protein [Bacteroidales bacterium]
PFGENWFIHFQDKGAYGRIVHLQPVSWGDDGWPEIGEDPDGDGTGQPVSGYTVPRAAKPRTITPRSPYGLPLEWQFPAVPSPYWYYAMTGDVRLFSVQQASEGLWNCPNLMSQKFPAESFTVEATLTFMPNPQLKQHGETAGFVVTGNSYAGLQLLDGPDGIVLQYIECQDAANGGQQTAEDLCEAPFCIVTIDHSKESLNVPQVKYSEYRKATVRVRLQVTPQQREGNVPDPLCRFSYSLDGSDWTPVDKTFTAQPELWIGARFGFYCNRTASKNDSGWLDITNISVSY